MQKKIVLFFLGLLAASIVTYSQPPKPNSYIRNARLNRFVGTWIGNIGSDTIRFVLLKKKKVLMPLNTNVRVDLIVGFHSYTRGDSIIESSLEYSKTPYADKKFSISGIGKKESGRDIILGTITDITKGGKLFDLKLILNSKRKRMEVELANREGIHIGWAPGRTLPEKFILYKCR
ncbi:DUF6705 family protein [Niabella beijingensis]|uniref:DUF6705 family protein n=1 Tax=Niabella beijingensis TaxID=2872700 RepID=UPI001CBC0407|nr:DUF6705 family protein [Niabella beijingensis]MBZ4187679.1 hypothetical protein [Niabella beijingensis]